MAEHGTTARYQKKCRCGLCRRANADYQREYNGRGRERDPEGVKAKDHEKYMRRRNAQRERARQYYLENAENLKAKSAARHLANREEILAKNRARHAANPQKHRDGTKAWREANKEAVAQHYREYRAANKATVVKQQKAWLATDTGKLSKMAIEARRRGCPYTPDALEYIEVTKRDPCSYCGGPSGTVDHIVPIASGGTGDWDNLAIACKPCNSQKGTRSVLTFLLDRARRAGLSAA